MKYQIKPIHWLHTLGATPDPRKFTQQMRLWEVGCQT